MYKRRRRVIPLTEEEEVVVDLGFRPPGTLVDVSVDYHALIRGSWRSVVRYDNAHGFSHVHRAWLRRSTQPLPSVATPTALLKVATRDLLANWHRYRTRVEVR